MYFVKLEKDHTGVHRKVFAWTMRKKGILEVLVRSVIGLHEGAKTRVRVDSELSEEFEVKVGMHKGCVLSLFLFAVIMDVVNELTSNGVLNELLYADDLVLLSEIIKGNEINS